MISIPILKVTQPIGDFFVGKVDARKLLSISSVDIRKQSDKLIYQPKGLQRIRNQKRINEIKDFITSVDASFPNSIIINLSSDYILNKSFEQEGILKIKKDRNAANIIDGQHRLFGFEGIEFSFELIVSIFIDLEVDERAYMFSTINSKQIKVNPSLAYDLFEFEEFRSPQKTAHDIVKGLNFDPDSPWYKKINMLGRRHLLFRGDMSQSTFIKYLLPLISENPTYDRDQIKRGDTPNKYDLNKCIFNNFFVEEKDEYILKILRNYFNAVKKVWPEEWENKRKKYILTKTTGYISLMNMLPILFHSGKKKKTLEEEFFYNYFKKAKGKIIFTSENFPPGSRGERELKKVLIELLKILDDADNTIYGK